MRPFNINVFIDNLAQLIAQEPLSSAEVLSVLQQFIQSAQMPPVAETEAVREKPYDVL
jgi:hypothetical protein